MKPSKCAELVTRILTEKPEARDCDFKLVAIYHNYELKRIGLKKSDYMEAFYLGKLSPSKSIERARRKIMQHNETLRGKSYKKRKTELEQETRKNIKEWNQ